MVCGPLQLIFILLEAKGSIGAPAWRSLSPSTLWELYVWAQEPSPSCSQCSWGSYPTEQSQGCEWCVMLTDAEHGQASEGSGTF